MHEPQGSHLGVAKIAQLHERPRAVVQQRVFELDVAVDDALKEMKRYQIG
jgi:hypothetical protein